MNSTTVIMVGALGGVVLLGLIFVNLTKKRGLLLGFAGMLLSGSLATGRDWVGNPIPTVWLPIQGYRSELFFAFGLLTLAMIVIQLYRQRHKGISPGAWVMVLLGMYMAMLRFVHSGPADGSFSVAFVFATLVPMACLPRAVIDDADDVVRLVPARIGF